jgi:hypothetical protein
MIKFGEKFGERYFLGDKAYKKEFIKGLSTDGCPAAVCYQAFINLIESLPMTSSDREMCNFVLGSLFISNPNWFIIPTSTGGKYHGGINGMQNSCGGIYYNCVGMIKIADGVFRRYSELIDGLGTLPFDFPSKLLACILLHDIGRLAFSQDTAFSVKDHGERGVVFIESLGYASEAALLYAISNHMYGWKVINVFNQVVVSGASVGLILLCMLCECDFFGSLT